MITVKEYLKIMRIAFKVFILVFILFFTPSVSYAQMTKEEVLTVLSLENYNGGNNIKDLDIIYERYLNLISYKPIDFIRGIGFSALSGIGEGAMESNEFGYTKSGWLPGFLKDWYISSPFNNGNPDYQIFGWQNIWREVDYASDREAYETLKLFFRGTWYYALLVHWMVKNTFATIVRDKFRYDNFLFSFQFDLVISIKK